LTAGITPRGGNVLGKKGKWRERTRSNGHLRSKRNERRKRLKCRKKLVHKGRKGEYSLRRMWRKSWGGGKDQTVGGSRYQQELNGRGRKREGTGRNLRLKGRIGFLSYRRYKKGLFPANSTTK